MDRNNKGLSNKITMIFTLIVIIGVFISKQEPFYNLNNLMQSVMQYSLLALALILPIMAGMGLNFSIVVGAIAGQIGIIMAVNWGLTGFYSFIFAAFFGTCFAILFGLFAGVLIDKARGHEMVTSLFIGYFVNGIYQLVLFALIGTVIPIRAEQLLLSGGVGLRNSIDLSDTLFQSVDGLLEVPFFVLLIIISVLYLIIKAYQFYKGKVESDKLRTYLRMILPTLVVLVSAVVMYADGLPNEIAMLKNIGFPLITGAMIGAAAISILWFMRTKLGREFIAVALKKQNSEGTDMNASKVRIMAIVMSTILASWGQIIFLQNTGVLSTYGSHMGVGLLSAAALILGGATIKRATVGQAFIGVVLLRGLFILFVPVIGELYSGNLSEVFRIIVMNGVFLYAFIAKRNEDVLF
ncbi:MULTISPECIES: hypothetical protein [unclassified Fusibacter]|uniref:hypothetical protein n=1 Tax=unclassified Fusibacter TaxID=2624464 RepID=UPI0013E97416|nr:MULTISPECIES: hypothetical protein [unclassified Fusibacter]MCK8058150.1 hypothetical protein [Fusibacter sp. A2]NPE20732.1 hypothetical protein [Fusibacter sp. A1]